MCDAVAPGALAHEGVPTPTLRSPAICSLCLQLWPSSDCLMCAWEAEDWWVAAALQQMLQGKTALASHLPKDRRKKGAILRKHIRLPKKSWAPCPTPNTSCRAWVRQLSCKPTHSQAASQSTCTCLLANLLPAPVACHVDGTVS